MINQKNTRRVKTQFNRLVNNIKNIPELVSGSSTSSVTKRQALKMPKQVRQLSYFTIRGFTLIELLVVVLIIAILASVALPQYQKAVEKSRLTEALNTVRVLKLGIESYFLSQGLPSSTFSLTQSLDIGLGMSDCDAESCYSKNFQYRAYCTTSQCCVFAYRIQDKEEIHYNLSTCYEGEEWLENYCTYEDEFGETICKSIENQGWESNN